MDSFIFVPIILALVQAVKMTNYVKARYLPLAAIILGIAAGLVFGPTGGLQAVLESLTTGLASIGLWELGSKTVVGKR